MLLMICERLSPGARGELSRWLCEVVPGVFVGHASALVRDELWSRFTADLAGASIVQIWSTNSEQGFDVRVSGPPSRFPVEFDGLKFFAAKDAAWLEAAHRFGLSSDNHGGT